MKSAFRHAAATVGFCLASMVFAADKEKPAAILDVTQLPAPVQTVLRSEGARIDKVEQSTESGTMSYRATLSKANKNYSLVVGSDGKIIKREEMSDPQQKSK